MKRLGTVMKAWVHSSFSYGQGDRDYLKWSERQPLMRQVGTDMAKRLKEEMVVRRVLRTHRRFKNASNVPA